MARKYFSIIIAAASVALASARSFVATVAAAIIAPIAAALALMMPDSKILFAGMLNGARVDNERLDRRPRLAWAQTLDDRLAEVAAYRLPGLHTHAYRLAA